MKIISHQKNKSDLIKSNNILNDVMINPSEIWADPKKATETPKKMIVRVNKQIVVPNDFSSLILLKDESLAIKTMKTVLKEPESDLVKRSVETPTLLRKNTKSASADKKLMLQTASSKQEDLKMQKPGAFLAKKMAESPLDKSRAKQILQDFKDFNQFKMRQSISKVTLKNEGLMSALLQKQEKAQPVSVAKRGMLVIKPNAGQKTPDSKREINKIGDEKALIEKHLNSEQDLFHARIFYKNQKKEFKLNIAGKTTDWLIDQMTTKLTENENEEGEKIIGFANTSRLFILDYYTTLINRDISFLRGVKLEYEVITLKKNNSKELVSMKDFHFIKMIGTGGFSKVFVVRKKDTGKFYALKLIDREFINKNKKEGIIKNERQILASLNHPFIVNLHFAFKTKNYLVFAMEFCAGGELYYHLRKKKRFKEKHALLYFLELCLAVMYLHGKNIVYRDLKPENILIDIDGHIKLADFGLAKPNISQDDMAYSFCGSAEYMSPEMLLKRGHSHGVDIYSLGTILYEFVTGSPPFYSKNIDKMYNNILKEELTFPEGILLSKELRSLLSSLLTKIPEERIGFRQGIREILSHPWCSQLKIMDVFHKRIKATIQPDYITLYFEDIQEEDIDPIVYEKVTEDIYRPQFTEGGGNVDQWFGDFYFEKQTPVEGKHKEELFKRANSATRMLNGLSENTGSKTVLGHQQHSTTSSSLQTTATQSPTADKTKMLKSEKRIQVSSLDRNRSLGTEIWLKDGENVEKDSKAAIKRENFHEETNNGFSKIILNDKQRNMINIYSCKNQNLKLFLKKKNLSLSPQQSNMSINSTINSSRRENPLKANNQSPSTSPSVRVISQTLRNKIKNFFNKNERLPQFYLKKKHDGEQSSMDSKGTLKSESIKDLTEIFIGNQPIPNPLKRNNSKVDAHNEISKGSTANLLNSHISIGRLKQNYIPIKATAIKKEGQV